MLLLILTELLYPSSFGFHRQDEVVTVSFNDLQAETRSLDDTDLDSLPVRISTLNGKRVRIRGYIYGPSMATRSESRFLFVRDAMEYSPWPECNNIVVTMTCGTKIDYTVRPITIEGTFAVTERFKLPNAKLSTFYRLRDATIVKP